MEQGRRGKGGRCDIRGSVCSLWLLLSLLLLSLLLLLLLLPLLLLMLLSLLLLLLSLSLPQSTGYTVYADKGIGDSPTYCRTRLGLSGRRVAH